jgi:heme exporter protein A
MSHHLSVQGLTRVFGEHYALIELTAEFYGGEVCALLGPNGAGKSTLMHLLSTLMKASEGKILIDQQDITQFSAHKVRNMIGYVGHQTMLYPSLTAFENLKFFAQLYQLNPKQGLERLIMQSLEEVGLAEVAHRSVNGFSRGMTQRLTLARAFLPRPKILLLDEPFTGLDQAGIEQSLSLLRSHKQRGTVIILSSHDLNTVDKIYDRLLILKRGRLAFYGPALSSEHTSLIHYYQQSISA